MPTYHLAAACRLVTKPSRRECLSSDRNQRFEKVAAGAASHSVVDLSTHSSDDHACLSTTTSESTLPSASIPERAETSTDTEQTAL